MTERRRILPPKSQLSPDRLPYVEVTKAGLRWSWTSRPAASLPFHHRQAAAADPTLEWDEDSRSYRRKPKASPAPRQASGGSAGEGRGA